MLLILSTPGQGAVMIYHTRSITLLVALLPVPLPYIISHYNYHPNSTNSNLSFVTLSGKDVIENDEYGAHTGFLDKISGGKHNETNETYSGSVTEYFTVTEHEDFISKGGLDNRGDPTRDAVSLDSIIEGGTGQTMMSKGDFATTEGTEK